MRFLVTGGAGFIGSHLCERLLNKGHDVVSFDDFNDYYDPAIKERNIEECLRFESFRQIRGDILDFKTLSRAFEEGSFDIAVHLAARAGVRPSIENPLLYQKVNVEGTAHILELCSRYRLKKLIVASSSSVYGKNEKIPFSESDPVDHPISPYAATKKACELLAYTYFALHRLPVACLRFFTVYGPRQRPDMAIHRFTRGIAEGREIVMYGDGHSRRDYTYISDIIGGVEAVIERCTGYHIYNLGESRTTELTELIGLIEKSLGKKAKLRRLPDQPGDVPVTYADVTRAREELGYHPSVQVSEGIPMFVDWFLKRNEK